MITLPYINGRAYIHSSSFVEYVLKLNPKAQKVSFDFHHESLNNCFEFKSTKVQPFDKQEHNVTGQLDDTYFGFRDVGYECSTRSRSIKDHRLNNVEKADIAWVFSQHMKECSSPSYDQTKQRLLLSSIVFTDLTLVPELANFNMILRAVDSRLQGMFYRDGKIVCRIRMLVRNK